MDLIHNKHAWNSFPEELCILQQTHQRGDRIDSKARVKHKPELDGGRKHMKRGVMICFVPVYVACCKKANNTPQDPNQEISGSLWLNLEDTKHHLKCVKKKSTKDGFHNMPVLNMF
eukprot:1681391-Amphidinium_carterae.1